VSWNPFVKSKKSATRTTTTRSVVSTARGQAFFTTMLAITFAAFSQPSSVSSSPS
jgi:hypothetical protein